MLPGIIATLIALAVTTGAGLLLRARTGRFRAAPRQPTWPHIWQRLGLIEGTPVTLVQFSSAFCAPCRATRTLCTAIAASTPGVRHIDIDAESHLAEVRELGIWKTPTVLLIDNHGRERLRASGLPTRSQLVVAIESVLTPANGTPVA